MSNNGASKLPAADPATNDRREVADQMNKRNGPPITGKGRENISQQRNDDFAGEKSATGCKEFVLTFAA